VAAHDLDNLAAFVLYDLAHPKCFNLRRVAFFVDNPDFNCLKGIVGIADDEHCYKDDAWQTKEAFSKCIENSQFNTRVRAISQASLSKNKSLQEQEIATLVKQQLLLHEPVWFVFKTKYGNNGILVAEQAEKDIATAEHMPAGAALLAFCPIF